MKTNFSKPLDYSPLRQLGFSALSVSCYQSLYEDGSTGASGLVRRLHVSRPSIYRALTDLKQKGFITGLESAFAPTQFHAIYLNQAIANLALYQHRQIKQLIYQQEQDFIQRRMSQA